MSFLNYTIKELEDKLHKKELSAVDIVDIAFKRIQEVEDDVKAFITLNEEKAYEQAKALDKEDLSGYKLFAMPTGIKDNLMTKDIRTTSASSFLSNFDRPLFTATAVQKLENEKAITIGKVNMDEFAMGSTTEHSSFHETRNPWNLEHVPGGSSGGSAAAVAAGEVLFSLGSDTGGSIRQPAAFTGIVGMKPTYGRVSRYGLIAMAPSLDQVGPMTYGVEDNARVLEVISGHDPLDSTSKENEEVSFTEKIAEGIKGLKIAVPQEYMTDDVDPEIKEAVLNALKMFELLGATVENVSLPHTKYGPATYYMISAAEASTSLARFDGVRFGKRVEAENMIDMMKLSRGQGFGQEVKKRILLGTHVLSSTNYENYFTKAQKVRALIKKEFDAIFDTFDLVIGPTTATTAFKLGETFSDSTIHEANDLLAVPANLAGLPAMSLPCGFSEAGLPIGLQIIGKPYDEQTMYQAAYAYEQATNHHKKRPMLEGESK